MGAVVVATAEVALVAEVTAVVLAGADSEAAVATWVAASAEAALA